MFAGPQDKEENKDRCGKKKLVHIIEMQTEATKKAVSS